MQACSRSTHSTTSAAWRSHAAQAGHVVVSVPLQAVAAFQRCARSHPAQLQNSSIYCTPTHKLTRRLWSRLPGRVLLWISVCDREPTLRKKKTAKFEQHRGGDVACILLKVSVLHISCFVDFCLYHQFDLVLVLHWNETEVPHAPCVLQVLQ